MVDPSSDHRNGICPVCGADVSVDTSLLLGDTTCPRCGNALWFLNLAEPRVFEMATTQHVRDRVHAIIAKWVRESRTTVTSNPFSLRSLHARDSIDVVELVMELEEELDAR
jgi:acyl carrier protein